MPKLTVSGKPLEIVDLIRDREQFQYITVPKHSIKVEFEVTVTTKLLKPKAPPSALFTRLSKVAEEELERYEEVITVELTKIEEKVGKLLEQADDESKKKAEELVATTNVVVKNALESAKGAADEAVQKRLKKEAQNDDLLVEAKVKLGFTITTGVISLSANVAKLVVTSGADVTSYLSIAKTVYDLGKAIHQELKDEEQLHTDLQKGVNAFLETRTSVIVQAMKRQNLTDTSEIPKNPKAAVSFIIQGVMKAGKEVTQGRDAKTVAKDVLDFVVKGVKSKLDDAEKARVAYRDHTTKMRQKVDDVSRKADELEKAMKAAKTIKLGVEIGAKTMTLKATVRSLAKDLDTAEEFLVDMEMIMKAGGLECDDSTVIQKLKKIDVSTILENGATLASVAYDVFNLVKNVSKAVA